MAGVRIEFDLQQLAEVQRTLAATGSRLASPEPLLADIGEYLLNATDERFDRRRSPSGAAWAPVSDRYARRKRAGQAGRRSGGNTNPADVLELSGDLRRLIRRQVIGDTLEVGSDRAYAAVHQFGSADGRLPPRPFLGISSEDEVEIAALLSDYLRTS